MSSVVEKMVAEIKSTINQSSSSHKDEVTVMQAMLNDPTYKVAVYKKDKPVETYCPAEDARHMISGIISDTTKISGAEADALAAEYQFSKSATESMINLSKEFVNTYLQTGRKLPLGGRERSDVSLEAKTIKARECSFPKKIGVDTDGKNIYKNTASYVPEHDGIKVTSPCPTWVK